MSTKTKWGIAINITMLGNDNVQLKSDSENLEKFTLNKFGFSTEKLNKVLSHWDIELPPEISKVLPNKNFVKNLVIDSSKNPNHIEFEVGTGFSDDFVLNKFDKLITLKETKLFFKMEGGKKEK